MFMYYLCDKVTIYFALKRICAFMRAVQYFLDRELMLINYSENDNTIYLVN